MPLNEQANHIYEFGPYRLEVAEQRLWRAGEFVPLPPKVFDLLLTLLRHQGQALSKDELLRAVWPDTIVEEVNLSVNISALRKALGEGPNEHQFIETLPRRGYRFVAPVKWVVAAAPPLDGAPPLTALPPHHASAVEPAAALAGWFKRHQRGLWFALAALVLGGLAAAASWRKLSGDGATPLPAPPRVALFTGAAGRESAPAFSPDGNLLAFVWSGEHNENQDIYIRLLDGGNLLRLTSDPADDLSPAWSPNGRRLAFFRDAPDGGVYVVPTLGGTERKLANAHTNRTRLTQQAFLCWSPDGQWLALADKTSPQEPYGIFLLSSETGEKRRLTAPPVATVGDLAPAFSPDGRWLAFIRSDGFALDDVYLVAASGGAPVRLTFTHQQMSGLAWTADSRALIFSAGRYCGQSLWRIPTEGGQPTHPPTWIAAAGQNASAPATSRAHLAWTQCAIDNNIWRLDLRAANAPHRAASRLLASRFNDVNPRYAPDGKRIAFASARSGSHEIWVCGSEGEPCVQLTFFRGPHAGSPRWSPDGRWIVFDCRSEGNADLFVISAEGGNPRRLTTEPGEEILPSWSRDGKWIYFTSNRSGALQIWKLPAPGSAVTGSEAVQVTRQGGYKGSESVDGQWLYYTKERDLTEIWRIPAQGGSESLVLNTQEPRHKGYWALAETGLYFFKEDVQASPTVNFFDFATGQTTLVAVLQKGTQLINPGVAVSPDGRWLLYTQVDQQGSNIMLMEDAR